jgi:hypothetical protein
MERMLFYISFCVFLQPHVRVWNSVSLHTLAVIGIGEFERSICCLSFSKAVSTLAVDLCTDSADMQLPYRVWQ